MNEFEKKCQDRQLDPELVRLRFAALKAEEHLEYQLWVYKLPFMKFPPHWEVKAIPPFNSLMVRYRIRGPKLSPDDYVSIYLDCHNIAGFMPWPYWEMYGGFVEDCCRCKWDNIDGPDGFMEIVRKRLGE